MEKKLVELVIQQLLVEKMALANASKINPTSFFPQFDFILCRLVCMDREIKCFVKELLKLKTGIGSL